MTAKLLNGKLVAQRINQQTKKLLAELKSPPGLAVVLVGNDPASQLYVSLKEKACKRLGINFFRYSLTSDTSPAVIISLIQTLNEDPNINGIIVQLPLPHHLPTDEIIKSILPSKDADGFHPANKNKSLVPAVLPEAIIELLKETEEPLKNKTAVILSKSSILFDEIVSALTNQRIHCQKIEPENEDLIGQADIIIVALGKPNTISNQPIKPGAIIIDIGTNRLNDKLFGDVDFDSVKNKAGWITPVPGGVGPVTVATLLKNVVLLAKKQQ